ncbi:MAG: glycosyltransferase [Desulfococcaceae bacterium]
MTDFHRRLQIVEQFLEDLDAGRLFSDPDPARRRTEFRRAWIDLLVWDRPRLEAGGGLAWPYDALSRRRDALEEMAATDDLGSNGQARRTLGLLPFPGGWKWTRRIVREMAGDPEVRAFVDDEDRRIRAKIAKKDQKSFKLRHFCQVLKSSVSPDEPGVLRIFSLPYAFARRPLLEALSRHYILYVEPPWGVLARHAWLRKFCELERPVLFGLAGAEDRAFLASQPGLAVTALCHGDFLEDEAVPPRESPEFDLIFNATFDDMPRKRHDFFLTLLGDSRLQNVRALCIGRGEMDRVGQFEEKVRTRGLSERVAVRANLPRREVPELLARCRAGVQVSLHENGPRAIYECLRSDLPVVLSSCTAGVDFDTFQPPAGRVAPDAELADAIREALDKPDRFRPAETFRKRTGSEKASEMLNSELRELSESRGLKWTRNIVRLGSSGASRYVREEDLARFRPEFQTLLTLFREKGMPLRLRPE